MTDEQEGLEELGKEELKDLAREHDLPVSGSKDELVERLEDAGVEAGSAESEIQPPELPYSAKSPAQRQRDREAAEKA